MSFILVVCATGMFMGSCDQISQQEFKSPIVCKQVEQTLYRTSTYSACVEKNIVRSPYKLNLWTKDLLGKVARKDQIMMKSQQECEKVQVEVSRKYGRKLVSSFCSGGK